LWLHLQVYLQVVVLAVSTQSIPIILLAVNLHSR
jgi:hypothetical protein